MRKKILILMVSLVLLSGCGNLSQTLTQNADRYASGKQEENYYLQSSGYRMKELLKTYTTEYRGLIWEYGILEQDSEPDGWNKKLVVSSDACVSSSREMYQVLTEAFTEAALGVSLQFDRSNFLPEQEELEEWISNYVKNHPLDTLGVEKITVYQKETVSDKILYFVFSYETGLKTIKELRTQTEEAADDWIKGLGKEIVSEQQKAEAVWLFLTEQVKYPERNQVRDGFWRADGAMLEYKANAQGFAEAASMLFSMLGLENQVSTEEYEISDTKKCLRIWNRVRINGEWYQMDCCFGAVTQGNRDFFLVKEEIE